MAVLLAMAGCADVERGPRPSQPDAAPDVAAGDGGGMAGEAGGISFTSVRPLIDEGCRRCHSAGGMAATSSFLLTGETMADYTAVRPLVDLAAPAGSRLLTKASGQGHGGGVIYKPGSSEYAALLTWIETGAAP
jgi:hypothetical protein